MLKAFCGIVLMFLFGVLLCEYRICFFYGGVIDFVFVIVIGCFMYY